MLVYCTPVVQSFTVKWAFNSDCTAKFPWWVCCHMFWWDLSPVNVGSMLCGCLMGLVTVVWCADVWWDLSLLYGVQMFDETCHCHMLCRCFRGLVTVICCAGVWGDLSLLYVCRCLMACHCPMFAGVWSSVCLTSNHFPLWHGLRGPQEPWLQAILAEVGVWPQQQAGAGGPEPLVWEIRARPHWHGGGGHSGWETGREAEDHCSSHQSQHGGCGWGVCVCVCACVCVCVCVHMWVCICAYVCVYVCV